MVENSAANTPESRPAASEKPFCVGVFETVDQASQAVDGLLNAGFDKEHITVVCSDKAKELQFHAFEHEHPAGADAPVAAARGGAIGALLGVISYVAVVVETGGLGLIALGPFLAGTGAIVGGFIGAMSTRSVERELANYYDQSVTQGMILVAAEDHGAQPGERLAEAERILKQAGSQPVRLREG